ncbi:hypothetical protein ACHHYP_20012 [Achlya hypogyna]|uniref:Uncharacterized protein n=1 Tax=Achlya hypogyna TaxID=1202772 RepID=A0A1V9ZAY5_ACHHY|nr:hypothetical protein ACHHYP_20012 [Achlya hypogyna]
MPCAELVAVNLPSTPRKRSSKATVDKLCRGYELRNAKYDYVEEARDTLELSMVTASESECSGGNRTLGNTMHTPDLGVPALG